MKYLILILLVCNGLAGFGQGNLQFNQAIFIELGPVLAGTVDSINLIVPSSKVVKLESASTGMVHETSNFLNNKSSSYAAIYLNDNVISSNTSNGSGELFPIWLKEGIYTFKLLGTYSPYYYKGFVSGIEFNITPP